MIALSSAGVIRILIARGRADLFSVRFDCDAERGLLLHTPTFSARLGADGLETSFLLLSIAFSRTETGNSQY